MSVVAVAVVEGASQFEIGSAWEVFGVDRRELTDAWPQFRFCLAAPGPVTVEGGLTLDSPFGLDELVRADTVIVPPCPSVHDGREALLAALREAHARGARIASICTGAFVLAEAGLLDGRRATTHWAHAAALASRFPAVEVDPAVLYVEDGRVFTSAGSAAGIDLCLHLLRLELGAEVANAVARRMVIPPHRDGGQAQFVETPMPARASETLGPVLDWALAHLDRPLSLDELARHGAMSVRTLVRRFQASTGTTPLQWVLTQRLRRAQHLLEASEEPVERVASLSGFGTAANLRQHFTRAVGVSPMAYRRTFRGRLAG
jgi:AraC family transcriptional regulator, transcriptional activator FtrA